MSNSIYGVSQSQCDDPRVSLWFNSCIRVNGSTNYLYCIESIPNNGCHKTHVVAPTTMQVCVDRKRFRFKGSKTIKMDKLIHEREIISISSVSKWPHIANALRFDTRCRIKFHLYVPNQLILLLPHEYPTLVLESVVRWNNPCIESVSKNDDHVRCHVDGDVSVWIKIKFQFKGEITLRIYGFIF